ASALRAENPGHPCNLLRRKRNAFESPEIRSVFTKIGFLRFPLTHVWGILNFPTQFLAHAVPRRTYCLARESDHDGAERFRREQDAGSDLGSASSGLGSCGSL